MTWQWLALGALALVALLLVAALARLRARTRAEIAAAREESAALRERLDRLEVERSRPVPRLQAEDREYTITRLGEEPATPPGQAPVALERSVFADQVLRESVIRLGSLSHGVRRALSAESRHRIRFQMRQEVKRSRKQRRTEQREAWREHQRRQRTGQDQNRDVA